MVCTYRDFGGTSGGRGCFESRQWVADLYGYMRCGDEDGGGADSWVKLHTSRCLFVNSMVQEIVGTTGKHTVSDE